MRAGRLPAGVSARTSKKIPAPDAPFQHRLKLSRAGINSRMGGRSHRHTSPARAIMPKKPAKPATPLDYLPGTESFLDHLRADADRPQDARAVVIPFGLEASVSYGSGTKAGPQAILSASQQLELFDEELWREPYRDYGIAALPRAKNRQRSGQGPLAIEGLVESVLDAGKVPFVTRRRTFVDRRRHPPVRAPAQRPRRPAVRCPLGPARRLSRRTLFARSRHAPRARPRARHARLGRHPRVLSRGSDVLRSQQASASTCTSARTRRAGTSTRSSPR